MISISECWRHRFQLRQPADEPVKDSIATRPLSNEWWSPGSEEATRFSDLSRHDRSGSNVSKCKFNSSVDRVNKHCAREQSTPVSAQEKSRRSQVKDELPVTCQARIQPRMQPRNTSSPIYASLKPGRGTRLFHGDSGISGISTRSVA